MTKRYIVIGTAALAADIAQFLINLRHSVSVWEKSYSGHSSLKALCEVRDISYRSFSEDNEISDSLREILGIDSLRIISAVNTYIFPKDIVENDNFSGINYHNALLPAHRGMNAEAWSIYNCDKVTGITWHKIASGVDKGELLCTREIPLNEELTSIKLLVLQSEAAYDCFLEIAEDFICDRLVGSPQTQEKTDFHFIKDVPNNGCLDMTWSAEKMSAFLRAMDYGILFTLGKPYVLLEEKKWFVGRYRMINTQTPFVEDEIVRNQNTLTIHKKGECTEIIISGLREADAAAEQI